MHIESDVSLLKISGVNETIIRKSKEISWGPRVPLLVSKESIESPGESLCTEVKQWDR